MTATGLKRFVPRFSLRTLVVFLLLVTSGFGLWFRRQPSWEVARAVEMPKEPSAAPGEFEESYLLETATFSRDGRAVICTAHGGHAFAWEVSTGRRLSEVPEAARSRHDLPDGRSIMDSEFGLLVLGRDWPEPDAFLALLGRSTPFYGTVSFSPDGNWIVGANSLEVVIYRRRRPEWWWGVFWLWEFWMTAASAGLFVWSVVRDRRALGKLET